MKPKTTQFKDDWNMNLGFVQHLTNLVIEADKMSDPRHGRTIDWFNTLRRIYRNVMGIFEEKETTAYLDKKFREIKPLFPYKRPETEVEKRINMANDSVIRGLLDELHADIVTAMHENRLILPVNNENPQTAILDMNN